MRAKKVAILESRLGQQLADLVAQRGGVPFHAPALAELPDLDPEAIGSLGRSLEERPAQAAGFQTREVLDCMKDVPVHGERVIVQRYGVVNVELDRALEARGASVIEIPTYRWSLPADTRPLAELIGALERGEMDAAVFTNAEQVRNLFAVAEQLGRAEALRGPLHRTLVASIGPVASSALREAKVKVGLESSPPKLRAFLSAWDP